MNQPACNIVTRFPGPVIRIVLVTFWHNRVLGSDTLLASDSGNGGFVFIMLEHRRRQVLHFNVTEHPTADWTSQQIVEAFADRDAPRYLIRDRDSIYGDDVRLRIASMGMEEVLTAPKSLWQNPYAERLIGSIRRDCLNHFVILNAKHLKRALASYFGYYHGSRTHLGLDKQCPFPRQGSSTGRIIAIPQVGGLHHRYERVAA
jgi:hypothetical protein